MAVALLLHAGWVLGPRAGARLARRSDIKDAKSWVKIRLKQHEGARTPKPQSIVAERRGAGPGAHAARPARPARQKAMASAPRPESVVPGSTLYGDLLPGRREAWSPGSGTETADDGVRAAPAVQAAAGEVGGQIDLPLVLRTAKGHGKATAKLRRGAASAPWRFIYVSGEPVLRAALFEGLRAPEQRQRVAQLFTALQDDEVLISLSQNTQTQVACQERYERGVEAHGNRVAITLTLCQEAPVTTQATPVDVIAKGLAMLPMHIPLPDPEAKRAQARDRVALTRLLDSPAFHSPIGERDPD